MEEENNRQRRCVNCAFLCKQAPTLKQDIHKDSEKEQIKAQTTILDYHKEKVIHMRRAIEEVQIQIKESESAKEVANKEISRLRFRKIFDSSSSCSSTEDETESESESSEESWGGFKLISSQTALFWENQGKQQ